MLAAILWIVFLLCILGLTIKACSETASDRDRLLIVAVAVAATAYMTYRVATH